MFLNHFPKFLRYKIFGVKRKPKSYFVSLIKRTSAELTGLVGLGILGSLAGILAENMQKIWNIVCKLPMDARIVWGFLCELLSKLAVSLKPSNLWRLLLSLPLEIRHINARCMVFLALYWKETMRLLRCLHRPRKLFQQIAHFLDEHIRNRNRIVRGCLALLCTVLIIRLFIQLHPYLHLILPAIILLYIKPFLPMMLHFLAGLAGKKVSRVIFQQLKKKINLLKMPLKKFDKKASLPP